MGELADDMIEGRSCSWCGIYFVEEHGYPVVCKDCAEGHTAEELLEKYSLQIAVFDEL